MFRLVRSSLLEEKAKLGKEVGRNPKGDMSYGFDLKAEEIAINYCREKLDFPVKVLSEETGEIVTKDGKPGYVFVIDPVDGSTNFKRGIEISSFSVAVLPAEKPVAPKNVEFALVGNLFTGSVCKAEKGKGCYFNNRKVETSKNTDVEKAIIGLDTDAAEKGKKKRYLKLLQTVKNTRRLGTSAAEATAVAIGALDAHVDIRDELTPENFMASHLLVKEAGGVFTDPNGNELPEIESLTKPYNIVVAGNQELHKKILELIEMRFK